MSRGHNIIAINPETGVAHFVAAEGDLPDWYQDEGPYAALKSADLKAEIEQRNGRRGDAEQIVPSSARKTDLVAALEADDSAHA